MNVAQFFTITVLLVVIAVKLNPQEALHLVVFGVLMNILNGGLSRKGKGVEENDENT